MTLNQSPSISSAVSFNAGDTGFECSNASIFDIPPMGHEGGGGAGPPSGSAGGLNLLCFVSRVKVKDLVKKTSFRSERGGSRALLQLEHKPKDNGFTSNIINSAFFCQQHAGGTQNCSPKC